MKVSLIQSNFIPWIGYLSIIKNSDLFILFEDVQYTKNDWRNRNKFLVNNNETWITIPVHYHSKQNFQTVTTSPIKFFQKFKKTFENYYSQNNNYKKIKTELESKIQIFDIVGRKYDVEVIPNPELKGVKIDLSHLDPGTYVVQIFSEKGMTKNFKIIKQ